MQVDIVFQPLPVGMSVEPVFSMSLAGEKQLLSSFRSLESGPDITFLLPLAREDRLLLRLVLSLSIGISGLPILPCGSLSPKVPIDSAFFSPPFRIYWTSRAALTKHHRLTGLYNRNVFPQASGGWKPKIRCWHVWSLLRPSFLTCRWLPAHYAHTRAFLFVHAAEPFTDEDAGHNSLGLPLIISFSLHHLFKGSVSSYSHTGWLELQHMNWRG